MRAGDFSELNRVIYDPLTHLPFPGNVIPANRFDPAARNILNQLIPEADTGGTRSATGQTINNYLINPIKERQEAWLRAARKPYTEEERDAARGRLVGLLDKMEEALKPSGWLVGKAYSIADIAAAPFVKRIDEEIWMK